MHSCSMVIFYPINDENFPNNLTSKFKAKLYLTQDICLGELENNAKFSITVGRFLQFKRFQSSFAVSCTCSLPKIVLKFLWWQVTGLINISFSLIFRFSSVVWPLIFYKVKLQTSRRKKDTNGDETATKRRLSFLTIMYKEYCN